MLTLYTNLKRPKDVVEAPPIADNVTVDARNLAILFSLRKYPPPEFKVPPHCLSLDNYNVDADNDSPNHTWLFLEPVNP